jgi:hypothetical protein
MLFTINSVLSYNASTGRVWQKFGTMGLFRDCQELLRWQLSCTVDAVPYHAGRKRQT